MPPATPSDETITFWLAVAGLAVSLGALFISLMSALYARRQAIAAEGPVAPIVEIANVSWRDEHWYEVHVVVRNGTPYTWTSPSVKLRSPKAAKVVSSHAISSYDRSGRYQEKPLNEIELVDLSSEAKPYFLVAPAGTIQSRPGAAGETAWETFLVHFPLSPSKLSMRFRLSSKAANVRDRLVDVDVRIVPKPAKAGS